MRSAVPRAGEPDRLARGATSRARFVISALYRGALAAALAVALAAGSTAAECPPTDPREPRTLILALDGVPYRAVRAAREMGAFPGWAETRPLVSPFPSMTNVGFAAILEPFGANRIPGYEIRRFDAERNQVTGGGVFSLKFDWREHFKIQLEGLWSKTGLYMTPRTSARKEMQHVEKLVLSEPDELMLALISSTDSMTHFLGDEAIIRTLLDFSQRIEGLRRRHQEMYGRALRVVMLSDHGNGGNKIRRPDGVGWALRRAGLHPAKRLKRATDVVTVTYGIVGYGALYLDPRYAETAARAVLGHEGVFLAAWRPAGNTLQIATRNGQARIVWRDDARGRSLAYRPDQGDPLALSPTLERMRWAGVLDEQGYASRADWFDWTAFAAYPDAPGRLVDSLSGMWVTNSATVIFSFEPGYAWGVKPAEIAAWVRAGRLETTHGGLDRESTWGFFMTSDPTVETPRAVRAELALERWAPVDSCTAASLIEFSDSSGGLHLPQVVRP